MVRTRFAPSPTGFLHVGGLRTALYNYLFARQNQGQFILRIEDTDKTREVEGAAENIRKIMEWAGFTLDEAPSMGGPHAPYVQSARTSHYEKYAKELIFKGAAYYCFCTADRLTAMREEQTKKKQAPKYDRMCLKLKPEEVEAKLKEGAASVIRQRIPDKTPVVFTDMIRGEITVDPSTIDDQVLLKSDGYPTYHLANVADDHDMKISHVIRGEEWLPSTPKHLLLYKAFGWTPPHFAHLPLLLNPDRSKLSKRQGHVAVEDYIREGYSKEAVVNFIALLGWHPEHEQEMFSLDDLAGQFSLSRVQKGGAVFDFEKLDWFEWQWKKQRFSAVPESETAKRAKILEEFCGSLIPADWRKDGAFLERVLLTLAEKILKDPKGIKDYASFYFRTNLKAPLELFENEKMKVTREISLSALQKSVEILGGLEEWNLTAIEEALRRYIAESGLKNGQVLWPLRAALTGENFSPGAFEVLWAFGKEESLTRLRGAIDQLKTGV